MLKVRVKFDAADSAKTMSLEGFAKDFPKVGHLFSIEVKQKSLTIQVDFGKVFNIKSYGDMLLVQTELIVAEVWIISGEREPTAEVFPFSTNPKALYLKGGKITALRRGASKAKSLTNLKSFIEDMKAEEALRKPKPSLRLIKGVNPS